MEKKFFNILMLLAVFSQIAVSFAEDEQLSDTLLRKKRVIHSSPTAAAARYAVSINKDGHHFCGGALLASNIVLTAAYCFTSPGHYVVLAGSNNINLATEHRIIRSKIRPHYNATDLENNLALLIVNPEISLHIRDFNREIQLYTGTVRSGSLAVLSGWGSTTLDGSPNIAYPEILQSAHVHVLSWQDCATRYGTDPHTRITMFEICTHDLEALRRSGYGDVGSPLTVAGYLVGILSWSRVVVNMYTPDVYTNVALPVYRDWIDGFVRNHGRF